jgi:hypothetical protein
MEDWTLWSFKLVEFRAGSNDETQYFVEFPLLKRNYAKKPIKKVLV